MICTNGYQAGASSRWPLSGVMMLAVLCLAIAFFMPDHAVAQTRYFLKDGKKNEAAPPAAPPAQEETRRRQSAPQNTVPDEQNAWRDSAAPDYVPPAAKSTCTAAELAIAQDYKNMAKSLEFYEDTEENHKRADAFLARSDRDFPIYLKCLDLL